MMPISYLKVKMKALWRLSHSSRETLTQENHEVGRRESNVNVKDFV